LSHFLLGFLGVGQIIFFTLLLPHVYLLSQFSTART
jgi:hypothetical protein